MDFENEVQKECYGRVVTWLKDVFGDSLVMREHDPVVGVVRGSAFAQVGVFPWRQDAIVTTRSYVVSGAELTAELMQYLLRENGGMQFGAFGVDDEGDIFFEHSIVGSTCDKKELEASVAAVVKAADDYDDLIVERWGGRRALDEVRA